MKNQLQNLIPDSYRAHREAPKIYTIARRRKIIFFKNVMICHDFYKTTLKAIGYKYNRKLFLFMYAGPVVKVMKIYWFYTQNLHKGLVFAGKPAQNS
jgi:hypothetical protein